MDKHLAQILTAHADPTRPWKYDTAVGIGMDGCREGAYVAWVNENTFLWRHEVSGKRLLRRRISLDKDEGPFEDEAQVYYILQYQKLPRMKKSKKAAILAKRAEQGHY